MRENRMQKGNCQITGENGFTLLELLVAMLLTVIASLAIYMAYNSQHKSYTVQEQVSAMQQNLRAAMYYMQRDIRMAGCDPKKTSSGSGAADAELETTNVAELEFTMDITGGESDSNDNDSDGQIDEAGEWYNGQLGDTGERLRFKLDNDANDDGIADGLPCNLGRAVGGGGLQDIAENIEVLNFVYVDEDGNQLNDDGAGNVVASMEDVRQIMITLIARSERPDPEFTNNQSYAITLPDGSSQVLLAAPNDNFRRRLLSITITPRNLGA